MPPYQLSKDLYVARATALSRNTNPRNYEFVWYPFWALVATHFGKRLHCNALSAPQYPLWCLWRKDEDFTMLIDSEPESVDADDGYPEDDGSDRSEPDSRERDDNTSEDEGSEGDMEDIGDAYAGDHGSFNSSLTVSSVEGTIDHQSRRRITDFAILLETVINHDFSWVEDQWEDAVDVIMPVPGLDIFSADISEWVLSLVEIKTLPSRSLNQEKQQELREQKMTQAQFDIRIQAAYFFTNRRWLRQNDIILIAGVGDYWRYTVASRTAFVSSVSQDDEYWEPNPTDQIIEVAPWSDEVRIGTQDSVRMEQQMVDVANEMWGPDLENLLTRR